MVSKRLRRCRDPEWDAPKAAAVIVLAEREEDALSDAISADVVARVRAVLRKHNAMVAEEGDGAVQRRGALVIDPGRRLVMVGETAVDLTFTEFGILQALARRPGWVLTRNQIIDAVRGGDYPVTERAVDVQIVSLRRKLGDYGDHIDTVRGVGYRFRE